MMGTSIPYRLQRGVLNISKNSSMSALPQRATLDALSWTLRANSGYRKQREHLTEQEVEKVVEAAKDHRWGHRDSVDLENAILHVRRVKQGTPATHPLTGRELRALRRLQRGAGGSSFVFVS
jgi:hypothetical protein